jgi:LemA protein
MTFLKQLPKLVAALGLALALAGCGVNNIPSKDQNVKARWADVQAAYQRRNDLIPNMVNTVAGYAAQEKSVLIGVTQARAQATHVSVDASTITDPAKFQQFQEAQDKLSGVLGRLMAISENYPDLKSNQNFLALQAQLEGTENRITVARSRYISSVQDYNSMIRTFPNNLTAKMFGYQVKPNFSVANEQAISTAPTVDFGNSAPAPAASAH